MLMYRTVSFLATLMTTLHSTRASKLSSTTIYTEPGTAWIKSRIALLEVSMPYVRQLYVVHHFERRSTNVFRITSAPISSKMCTISTWAETNTTCGNSPQTPSHTVSTCRISTAQKSKQRLEHSRTSRSLQKLSMKLSLLPATIIENTELFLH